MVEKPGDYIWSTYLDYIGERKPLIKNLDTSFILKQLDNDLKSAKKKYKNQVLTNITMQNPLANTFEGIAVGDKEFIDNIKRKISIAGRNREIAETKFVGAHSASGIIKKIEDLFGIKKVEIFSKRRNNLYRKLAIYLLKEKTTLRLREIGDMFNIDYVTVSSVAKRFEKEIRDNKKIHHMMAEIIHSMQNNESNA